MRITTDQISLFRRLDAELDINSDDFYKNIEHELSSLCKQEVILKHPDEALKSMKQSFSEAEEVLSYFQEKLTKLQSHSD